MNLSHYITKFQHIRPTMQAIVRACLLVLIAAFIASIVTAAAVYYWYPGQALSHVVGTTTQRKFSEADFQALSALLKERQDIFATTTPIAVPHAFR